MWASRKRGSQYPLQGRVQWFLGCENQSRCALDEALRDAKQLGTEKERHSAADVCPPAFRELATPRKHGQEMLCGFGSPFLGCLGRAAEESHGGLHNALGDRKSVV